MFPLQVSGVYGECSTGLVSEGSGVRNVKYDVYLFLVIVFFLVACIPIYLPARDFLRAFALYLYLMMLSYALRLRKTMSFSHHLF